MKRFIAVLLCLIMLLSLFSCGKDNAKDNEKNDTNNDSSTDSYASVDQITNTTSVNYDSVLEIYRLIVEKFPIVNQNPRALAYELGIRDKDEEERFVSLYSSIHLFYPGIGKEDSVSPYHKLGCGYSIKDLNGDGVDELVLLNSEYYVMAIFSFYDEKPVLLGNYWECNSCWIDDNGLLHNNGSNGSDYSTNAVYQIANGGRSLELVAEFGTNGHEWIGEVAYTKYYKVVDGEKASITENEYNALSNQYGKYLGSVAGAEATKQYSGLIFTSIYTEAEIAMEMYEASINDEICVVDEHLGEIKLKACRFPGNNLRLDESVIDGKVVFDMDGDGIYEYIIRSASMGSIVLHYFDGKVYTFSFYFRDFYNLNTDGSFFWNDSSATGYHSYGANKLNFDGKLLKIEEIYKIVNDGEANAKYYIYGKQTTHNEFLKYIEDNPNTPVEFTSFKAPWQKTISLEKALEIAAEYWYDCYNIKGGDIDIETGFPFAILPKNSSNENYCIALAWLVEGSHYSTLEMIEIDSITGEIINPESQVILSTDQAWNLANEYWDNQDGCSERSAGSVFTARIVLIDEPSSESNYYRFAFRWEHTSIAGGDRGEPFLETRDYDQILVNAFTGEIIPSTYNPDGKVISVEEAIEIVKNKFFDEDIYDIFNEEDYCFEYEVNATAPDHIYVIVIQKIVDQQAFFYTREWVDKYTGEVVFGYYLFGKG